MRITIIACCLLCACRVEENLGYTPVGAPRWAVTLGGPYNDRGLATAIDSIGDVVAVGDFLGAPDSQGNQGTTGFVTKRVASDGSERWTVQLLATAPGSLVDVMDVAIDPQDSVLITGPYTGTVDFGGQTLTLSEPTPPDHSNMYLAKYSWDGQLEWVRGVSSTSNAAGLALAIDSVGHILVTGTFNYGALTLAGEQYTNNGPNNDTFVAALDSSGALLWGQVFQGQNGGPIPAGIAVDATDNILVAGTFTAPASFGGAVLDPGGYERAYLARLRNDGLYLSSRVLGAGGSGESYATQVAVDASNLVVVQTIERDEAQELQVPEHGVVHVLDDDDQELWSSNLADNGDGNPQLRTLATAPSGVIVSSAWDDSSYNADDLAQVRGSMEVVAYDQNGHIGSSSFGSRVLGGLQATLARGCAVGSTGAVAYTGEFGGQVNFGTGPVMTHGQNDTDAFIVLLDPPSSH